MNINRILKEFKDINTKYPSLVKAELKTDENYFDWIVIIFGPKSSPFEGGIFKLEVNLNPKNYPLTPPKMKFLTKMFHPNVNESNGNICLDILQGEWSPALTILTTAISIISFLTDPNADSPLNSNAATLYKNNRMAYDKKVKDFTRLYASHN